MKQAFYDFAVSPYSFDFFHFMSAARSHGCERIVFVPGDRAWSKLTPEQEVKRFANILLPLAGDDYIVCASREEARTLYEFGGCAYPVGYSVDAPKNGHMLRRVVECPSHTWCEPHADEVEVVRNWLKGSKPVVLTIRQTQVKPERNSDIEEWRKFAGYLVESGEDVVIVPDTDAIDTMRGWPGQVWNGCAASVRLRHALYSMAKCNIGIANGPMMLSFFSPWPMLMLRPLTAGHWETSPDYWHAQGVPVGSQPRWFGPKQRIVWEDDSLGALINAWERWKSAETLQDWGATIVPYLPTVAAGNIEMKQQHMRAAMAMDLPRFIPADEVFSVVGYGPSLLYTWQDIQGAICTTSGAHDFLIQRGIVPRYHVECDPRPHKAMMFTPHRDVIYLIASCCHPDVFAKLGGHHVQLWHCDEEWTMGWLAENAPGEIAIGGGGNAGLRAIQLGGALGHRKFRLHGMDCSLAGGARHAGAHTGKSQPPITVECGGIKFLTTPAMVNSARHFMSMDKTGIEIELTGYGLLQQMVNEQSRKAA